ncbi:hypothetical protein HanXRQr2_Chr09g0364361 [Helianthus annuus]|uniref:Uncharacterized protein n=1 Tax=Helianthus annuus TaxID=4232 RepID=A0A9K3N6P1_HELAN|nr:protein TsetseEP-like [Helianthus annuus]KAF5788884.1 hypothetical protein HanXRQr2_Chr09g0364361 [Helianthus annuus]
MAAICTSVHSFSPPAVAPTSRLSSSASTSSLSSVSLFSRRRRVKTASYSMIVCMAPDEEKLTRRNPLDFPVEWERPKPGRRPDIFPQFSPMKTPLPPPLPYDPSPEEEEEEDEENKEEEEEDPDKEQQPETRHGH